MALIDTHSHIYLPHFDEDRDEIVQRAKGQGIQHIFLPNIDTESIGPVLSLCKKYPDLCFPMMGLHPTSVDKNIEQQLESIDIMFEEEKFIAVGECGIDLYWDKTFIKEQEIAFTHQISLAKKYRLPIVIHARESFNEIYKILEQNWEDTLTGVFHSFTGNLMDVQKINAFGFYFGINGIVTFKNSDLKHVIKHIEINKILLETDAPYLAPVPNRGKRNESSYIIHTAKTVSEIMGLSFEELSKVTTTNAINLFNPILNNGTKIVEKSKR